MTTTLYFVQGEADTVTVTFTETIDGTPGPLDISAATMTAELGVPGQKAVATIANTSIDKTDGLNGNAGIPLTATNTNQKPGDYLLEVTVVLGDGRTVKSQSVIIRIGAEVKAAT
jgi:hypothetical protein